MFVANGLPKFFDLAPPMARARLVRAAGDCAITKISKIKDLSHTVANKIKQ